MLVLGIGNSACDIAVESSRSADAHLARDAARRLGACPKYLEGKPTDELGSGAATRLPLAVTARS